MLLSLDICLKTILEIKKVWKDKQSSSFKGVFLTVEGSAGGAAAKPHPPADPSSYFISTA